MTKTTMTSLKQIRLQAREHVEKGAVTAGYLADRDAVVTLLNTALATELVCVLRYRRHHFMARGLTARPTADEFLVHSNEEMAHADKLAMRIVQLGGEPDYSPDSLLERSHAGYITGVTLVEMITEDLVAERIAIECYRELIQSLGERDPTTSDVLKAILAAEERHAGELADLLVERRSA